MVILCHKFEENGEVEDGCDSRSVDETLQI